ncbi:MAG: DUF456 domain-containing protein [candidate division Zixibacteria bacterium]|nr:DUF456 domain-containing protein [candidate division Zixibacteria bacterium]
MSWWEIVLFILSLIIMLAGLIGTLLPIIPGTPLIFGTILAYSLIDGFEAINGNTIALLAVLTGISLILDYLAIVFGVKKMGGSYFGVFGALVGMIVGLFFWATLVAIIIGPLIGAILAEMLIGKESKVALKAGFGSFIGFLVGGAVKFAIAATMIGIFIWNVLA